MPVILTVAGAFCCKILESSQTPLDRACPMRAGLYALRSATCNLPRDVMWKA